MLATDTMEPTSSVLTEATGSALTSNEKPLAVPLDTGLAKLFDAATKIAIDHQIYGGLIKDHQCAGVVFDCHAIVGCSVTSAGGDPFRCLSNETACLISLPTEPSRQACHLHPTRRRCAEVALAADCPASACEPLNLCCCVPVLVLSYGSSQTPQNRARRRQTQRAPSPPICPAPSKRKLKMFSSTPPPPNLLARKQI